MHESGYLRNPITIGADKVAQKIANHETQHASIFLPTKILKIIST